MNQHQFVAVSLVLLVFGHLVKAEADQQKGEVKLLPVGDQKYRGSPLAVNLVTADGVEVKFPYFGQYKFEIHPKHAEIAKEDATEMLEYFRKVVMGRVGVKRNFVSKWSVNLFGTVNVLNNLRTMGNKQYSRQVDYVDRLAINDPYIMATGPLFMFALNESKKALVLDDDQQKLRDDANHFVNAMIDAIQTSPVAHYLDFARGTINGKPFIDELAQYIARLRKSGCSTVIRAMEMIIKWSCRLSDGDDPELGQD